MAVYKFKTKPYKHQVQAIKKAMKQGSLALLMEPRTGKTKTAIDYMSILVTQGKIDRAVVICPSRVMDVWIEEFHRHCPLMYTIHVWDRKGRKTAPPPVKGPYQLTVLLVNYEAFGTPGKRLKSGRRSRASGRFAFRKQIQKWIGSHSSIGVLDESHKIKSPSGRSSTLIVSMRPLFAYRMLLTGTPVTKAKRTFDIYMQWKFLNPQRFADYPTADGFKNQFGVWTNRNGYPQFLKTQNLNELKEKIHKDSFAIKRADCFDLPPRTERIITVPLTSSGPVYDQLAAEMVAEFERKKKSHTVEATIPLTLALRLSQITGGYVKTVEGELVNVGNEKLRELEKILEESIENDEKLVIAAKFRADLDGIIQMANEKDIPIYPVRGGLTRSEVTSNIQKFNKTDGIAICAMNPAAGGLGIDLSTASHMVWYSLTNSWVDYSQACDRIALSPHPTTFTYLLGDRTVDEVLLSVLKTDGEIADAITKNPRSVLRNG